MSTHEGKWPQGTPCWVDFMASDLQRTHDFYTSLFGWDYEEGSPEFGGYHNALIDGRRVAGLSPTMPGMEDAPKSWTVYLASDDIDATRAAVLENGGQVVSEPMQIGEFGSMGVFSDPTGAVFGVWQGNTHTGIAVVDEHGTPMWLDVMTTDLGAAKDFYGKVFDYRYTDLSADGMQYVMFDVPGGQRPAGGIGQTDQSSSAWTVCFQVDDVDEVPGRISRAGGTVTSGPEDTTYGRMVTATGPDGETIYLMTPKPM